MKRPQDYKKVAIAVPSINIAVSTSIAIAFYWAGGPDIDSPALSSAEGDLGISSYAVAIPTITVAGVIASVISTKNYHKQFWRWRGQPQVPSENTWRSRLSWAIITFVHIGLALLIALALPIFKQLVPVIGASFGTTICILFQGLCGIWRESSRIGRLGAQQRSIANTLSSMLQESSFRLPSVESASSNGSSSPALSKQKSTMTECKPSMASTARILHPDSANSGLLGEDGECEVQYGLKNFSKTKPVFAVFLAAVITIFVVLVRAILLCMSFANTIADCTRLLWRHLPTYTKRTGREAIQVHALLETKVNAPHFPGLLEIGWSRIVDTRDTQAQSFIRMLSSHHLIFDT